MRVFKNLFGNGSKIAASEVVLSNRKTIEQQFMDIGTIIPNGTNMLTIQTPGIYVCPSNEIAKTLVNCPLTLAFKLEVSYGINTFRVIQRFHRYDGEEIIERVLLSGEIFATKRFVGTNI